MLVSLLHQFGPDEIELLIVDPKQTDFIFFDELPHLYGGHVVIDAEEALEKLQRINEVDKEERTKALRACRSKDIDSYNQKNPDNQMKRMVVVIDEYSDLIQAAEINGTRKKFESNLLMLLQRVRNLGIHLIIATQRPSAQIVTGKLKAVVPFRVSFRLPSHTDSQTILDMTGAENLLGKGDMLIKTDADTMRMQGLFVSEDELEKFLEKLDDWGENMQTVNSNEITEGYFIRELKNRFLCEVEVDSKLAVCYVPSSCHLSNFLDLHGKRVLLIPNKSKNTRTEYSLFAVHYKRSYIILNTSMANRAVEASIAQRRFSFLGKRKSVKKEITKGGYKWDLLIEESNTLVEIKSVISTKHPQSFLLCIPSEL